MRAGGPPRSYENRDSLAAQSAESRLVGKIVANINRQKRRSKISKDLAHGRAFSLNVRGSDFPNVSGPNDPQVRAQTCDELAKLGAGVPLRLR